MGANQDARPGAPVLGAGQRWASSLKFSHAGCRPFLKGVLCGTILMAVVGATALWWKSRPERSVEDNVIYDRCLAAQGGNLVACEALLRVLAHDRAVSQALEQRHRADVAALKEEVNQLLVAGFSKCEIVKREQGKRDFIGSRVTGEDLASAIGISFGDLIAQFPVWQSCTNPSYQPSR